MECSQEPGHGECARLCDRLSEFIDRELDPGLCGEIERHLEACPTCSACLATLERTVALCRALGGAESPPPGFSERLRAGIAAVLKAMPEPPR